MMILGRLYKVRDVGCIELPHCLSGSQQTSADVRPRPFGPPVFTVNTYDVLARICECPENREAPEEVTRDNRLLLLTPCHRGTDRRLNGQCRGQVESFSGSKVRRVKMVCLDVQSAVHGYSQLFSAEHFILLKVISM